MIEPELFGQKLKLFIREHVFKSNPQTTNPTLQTQYAQKINQLWEPYGPLTYSRTNSYSNFPMTLNDGSYVLMDTASGGLTDSSFFDFLDVSN